MMRSPAAATVLGIPLLLSTSGCGQRWFADRATNPVIEDYSRSESEGPSRYALFSTGATRRTILIDYNTGDREKGHAGPRVCSEPPPDAIEAYANALSAAFRAQAETTAAQGAKASSDTSAEVARTFATAAAPMLYRSQGLQLLRDKQYHLCNMRLNGDITRKEYLDRLDAAANDARELILAEMPALCVAAARPTVVVSATAPPLPTRTTVPGGANSGSGQSGGTGNQVQGQAPAPTPASSAQTITVSADTCARLNTLARVGRARPRTPAAKR